LDTEGRLQFMNFNGLCQMEIDDFISFKNKSWWTLWGSENEALEKASLDKVLTGETAQFTALCPTAKGTLKWWDVMVSPVGRPGEPVQQIISVSRDVTKQKDEEEKLKAVSAIANIGYWRLELDGNTLSWTDEVYKIWGREKESFELSFENFTKTIHPADLQLFEKEQDLAYRGLAPLDHIHRIILPGNKIRWVHELGRLVKDAYGKLIVFEGTVQDITKQKEEEQRLKLLESVITHTNDAVLITEAEPFDEPGNRVIYVNEAFTKMTGYTAEEILGKTPRILQGPDSDKEALAAIGRKIRNWEPCELTTINYKKNGEEFWINFSLTPVADEKGWYTHWVSIERDVTEQKIKELRNELLAQISTNFNANNNLVSAANELCKSVSCFGNFDLVEVWIANLEKSEMKLLSHYVANNKDENFYEESNKVQAFKMSESMVGKVWAQQKQLLWDDIENNKDFVRREGAKKIGLKAVLGIPLLFNGEAAGVLKIGTKHGANHLNNYSGIFKELELYIGSELNRKKLENDLSHLYQTIPDIMCIGDFQGRFLKINKAGCELLSFKEEEILYRSFAEFVHPDDKENTINDFKRLITEGKTNAFESRYISKTGAIVWLSWTCNSSSAEGLIYATAKNITEEKQLRELNRQVSNLAKIGSWELDVVNQRLFWSDEVHQLHETDPKTFIPQLETAINFYRENFRQMINSLVERSTTGESFDLETVLVTANKNERWIRAIGNAEIVDGKCQRIYGSFQDIDERKKSEINLAESENRFRTILEAEPECIKLLDSTGQVLMMNPAGLAMIEAENEEQVLGKSVLGIVIPEHRLAFSKLTENIFKGESGMLEFEIQGFKGTRRWLETHAVPLKDQQGEIISLLGVTRDITERKKAEEKLVNSEQKYRLLALDLQLQQTHLTNAQEVAKIGSWETDLRDFKSTWSDEIYRIFEIERNSFELTYEEFLKYVYPLDRDKVDKAFLESIQATNETQNVIEHRIITSSGEVKYIEERWKITYNDQGEPLLAIGSCQDITERKKAEEDIRESEEKRRLIMSGALDAIICIDTKETITFWNPQAEVIFGWKEPDVMGQSLSDLIVPEPFRKYHNEGIKHYLKTGEGKALNILLELTALKKSGEEFPIELTVIPVKQGGDVFFCAFIRDITQRKKAETLLQKSENKFRSLIENSNDMFSLITADGTMEYISPAIERTFGYTNEENKIRNVMEVMHPDDEAVAMKTMAEVFKNPGVPLPLTVQNRKKDGTYIWVEGTITNMLLVPGVNALVGNLRDITQRKKAED
ncbi:MAG: PAS domain S-box protein, partial [Ferruginibacter sp.]